MRTLSLTLALLFTLLLMQPAGSAVLRDGHGPMADTCHCEHGSAGECRQSHCTPHCAAACAGGCAPAVFAIAGGIELPAAAGPVFVQVHFSRYSDITLPVPTPPPIA